MDGNATPPGNWLSTDSGDVVNETMLIIPHTVEGAHSDEVRSVRSESDEGSRGGSRRLPPLLGDFDVLRFKNTMLEVCFSNCYNLDIVLMNVMCLGCGRASYAKGESCACVGVCEDLI